MEDLRKLFIMIDSSKDGRITRKEIMDGLVTVMGHAKASHYEFSDLIT